ncbi:unnamed protein product [Lota lota]
MYVNSPGHDSGSLSLTFLGKKVGRHHAVAPAGKHRAWETTNRSTGVEESTVSSRVVHAPLAAASKMEDLPGSVPDLREDYRHLQACPVYSTHIHQDPDNAAGQPYTHHKALWMKRWTAFRSWIAAGHRKRPGQEDDQEGELDQEVEEEDSKDVRIYIPYESAELCITQIAKDMEAMKNRHFEMVQELEDNFQIAARENQERTAQQIRAHYQNKMNALKRMLDLYQQKVEKKDTEWHKKVLALTAQREQLLEEQGLERRRCKEEAQQWHREKSKMLELFSNRLDLLHSHQASTLQELQLARQEVGKVQEMLIASQEERQEATKEGDTPENNDQSENPACSEHEMPLEGAKARLEELKESLYQREREITELLGAEGSPIPQPPCAILLPVVIQKAHAICLTVPEARTQLQQMIEENQASLLQARDKLEHLKKTREDQSPTEEETASLTESETNVIVFIVLLSVLEDTVREGEVIQMALDYIRTGGIPVNRECDAVEMEAEDILGRDRVQTSEEVKNVGQQLLVLQDQLKQVREENRKIIENYTSERTLRKKFYNMVEDMKGKIRVFCRIRPVNRTEAAQGGVVVVERLDDYSVAVETPRGLREFQFDRVFSAESSQEELFQDTHRLIQSAIDGFNVCIFAYGQTGSGKTFTMVGDREYRSPGIMPRAFTAMFDIIKENSTRFDCKVSAYMLELYNDQLQDLLVGQAGDAPATQSQSHAPPRRVEIKRNRKGVVFAQGAETKQASSAQELFALFQQACANRHISSTKMNSESSRSHLIMGIMVESRNLTNGSVSCGKLSLVDLAGSERAAKTGAKDHQLKEANSINKSLSALGDVISALSSELPHVPYRNSKLTQVMQDSLGGNAKTLMIVNISPSQWNMDETLTSLIYATRVKAITNHAQRNLESKEIAALKEVIVKLKSGQTLEEEEV